jgi:hypothetical protein
MIPKLRQVVETPWILRLDDDECASVELWQWLTIFAPPDGCKMISFPRRWVRFKSLLQLSYSASDRWNWAKSKNGEDRQFRLYDKNTVAYRQDIHTPGYVIEAEAPAPDSCVIYHLDWILRSQSERRAKLSRYDAQLPGAGQEFASYYLPELTDTWDHEGVVTDKALRHLANKFRVARVLRGARNAFRCNGSALPDSPAATK